MGYCRIFADPSLQILRFGVNFPCAPNLNFPGKLSFDLISGPGTIVQETNCLTLSGLSFG